MQKIEFAVLDYVKNKDEIPLRLNILKKVPAFILDWYVRRFNPLSIKKLNFDLVNGYFIKIPIEKSDVNNSMFDDVFVKTLKKFPMVKIIKLPDNRILDEENILNSKVLVARGNFLFAFLTADFIKKIFIQQKKILLRQKFSFLIKMTC